MVNGFTFRESSSVLFIFSLAVLEENVEVLS